MVLCFVLLNSERERKAMGKRMFCWEFPTASRVGWEVQPPPRHAAHSWQLSFPLLFTSSEMQAEQCRRSRRCSSLVIAHPFGVLWFQAEPDLIANK